jgi:hypothetical protein
MRSAPKTPVVRCHLPDQRDCLGRQPRLARAGFRCVLPKHTEELTRPSQKRLRLDDKERLFPGLNHSSEKQQAELICLPAGRSFDMSMQDDELLPQQRVFDKQFGLAFGKVCDRSQQKGGGARFHPTNHAIKERVKAKSYSMPERDENREHRLLLCEESKYQPNV